MERVLPPFKIYSLTRTMIRCSAFAGLLLFLIACSVSQDQEVAIGRQNAEEINAQLPIVTDPAISGYIQDLGESIAKTTSRSDLDWHFYVVNTKQVNAFALPGGYVYVNRGLIESADRLDELTGTLGHEIGHVIQRHSVKQMQSAQKANAGVAIVCTLTSICNSGLAQAAVQVGGTAFFAKHSRLDELQADSEGVVNVTRAGYDPEGIPRSLSGSAQAARVPTHHSRRVVRLASVGRSANSKGKGADRSAQPRSVTKTHRGYAGLPGVQNASCGTAGPASAEANSESPAAVSRRSR